MLDVVFKIIIGQISLIPKTNFIFIDESISVFDKERMDNISDFFDFLKRYYSNVFLITHMQQIKVNINYFLDISKYDNYAIIHNIEFDNNNNNFDDEYNNQDLIIKKKVKSSIKTITNDNNDIIGITSKKKITKK